MKSADNMFDKHRNAGSMVMLVASGTAVIIGE
jgi:hypothetical protein